MQATTIKPSNRSSRLKGVMKTNQTGRLLVENDSLPQAGAGACKLCSCKKFVPSANYKPGSVTSHQAMPCDVCGHDVRVHA